MNREEEEHEASAEENQLDEEGGPSNVPPSLHVFIIRGSPCNNTNEHPKHN